MQYPILDARATGARIKELRKKRQLRVEDVARFMGFESEQAVYKWQRGDSLPTVDNLYALSILFETSIDDILIGNKGEGESSLPCIIGKIIIKIYDYVTIERRHRIKAQEKFIGKPMKQHYKEKYG